MSGSHIVGNMVKKNNTQRKKKTAQDGTVARVGRRRGGMAGGLDSAARAYAQLLLDPCNGRLVRPIYAGSGSGYLARFQKTFTITNVKEGGCLSLLYAPGQIGKATAGWLAPDSPLGAITYTAWDGAQNEYKLWCPSTGYQPGYAFLAGQGKTSCRPIAACMRVRYTGKEIDRSGTCYTAYLPNADNYISETPTGQGGVSELTCQNLATASQFSTRTPDGTLEVKWSPNRGDMRFREPLTTSATLPNWHSDPAHAGMAFAALGLPANMTFEFTLTCVYEWMPDTDTGLTIPVETAPSNSSLDAVLGHLGRLGNWMVGDSSSAVTMRRIAYAAGSMYVNGMTGGNTMRLTMG